MNPNPNKREQFKTPGLSYGEQWIIVGNNRCIVTSAKDLIARHLPTIHVFPDMPFTPYFFIIFMYC